MKIWQACVVEQWRAWHGDARSFEANTRLLAQVPADSTFDAVAADVCEHTLYTIRALVQKQPDLSARVQALNAIMREGPSLPPMMLNAANIVLGRAAEQTGDRALAVRAFSRYAGADLEAMELVTTMMREQARLAALSGNTELAIRVYRRYLLLHERAEPALKAKDDAVRAHLARLVGERQ